MFYFWFAHRFAPSKPLGKTVRLFSTIDGLKAHVTVSCHNTYLYREQCLGEE